MSFSINAAVDADGSVLCASAQIDTHAAANEGDRSVVIDLEKRPIKTIRFDLPGNCQVDIYGSCDECGSGDDWDGKDWEFFGTLSPGRALRGLSSQSSVGKRMIARLARCQTIKIIVRSGQTPNIYFRTHITDYVSTAPTA